MSTSNSVVSKIMNKMVQECNIDAIAKITEIVVALPIGDEKIESVIGLFNTISTSTSFEKFSPSLEVLLESLDGVFFGTIDREVGRHFVGSIGSFVPRAATDVFTISLVEKLVQMFINEEKPFYLKELIESLSISFYSIMESYKNESIPKMVIDYYLSINPDLDVSAGDFEAPVVGFLANIPRSTLGAIVNSDLQNNTKIGLLAKIFSWVSDTE